MCVTGPIRSVSSIPSVYHWFLADGMVHGIRIRDGKAEWYRNRWVRGPHVAKALGEPSRFGHFGSRTIGANTNVIGHAGKTLAVIEAGACQSIELTDELETVGCMRLRRDTDRRVYRAPQTRPGNR